MARIKSQCLSLTLMIVWLAGACANTENTSDLTVNLDQIHLYAEQDRLQCGAPENRHIGTFTLYDYSIVLGMLVISLGIGVFYGFMDKSSSNSSADFLHGTEMSLITVSLSLTTSFITAIELLGNPSEMFFNGTQYSLIVISIALVIPVAIKIFYPIYFKLDLTSCYEYLGIRFNNNIRIFGAILYIIQMCFYTAVSVYAPAIALSKATGLNTHLAVFLIYVVCVFYSSQGGMKAVVIADTFQACVLAFSLVLVVVLGHFYTGGFTEIFEIAEDRGRVELLNFDINPTTRHTVFSVVVGGFFYWTSLLCTNQASVQKCMSLRKLKRANWALVLSIIGLVFVFTVNFYTGLTVFKHYADCDPVRSGQIVAKDELLPFYIMDVFNDIKFVNGFFVAGIFAASLGTVASALNSLSAVTYEDIFVTGMNIKIDPEKAAMYIKWMSLGYGIISFALVFLVEQLGGILQATLTLNGLIGGVTLGLFSLGVLFKSANSKGALYGGIVALVLVVYVGIMAQLNNVEPTPLPSSLTKCECYSNETMPIEVEVTPTEVPALYRISYIWYSFLGAVLTILFGLIISVITDRISASQILHLTASNQTQSIERTDEKCERKLSECAKNSPAIFIVEKYRKKSQMNPNLRGVDNMGMKMEEV
ncbi:sodium-coupled monocarboxylate transporter 1-like [Bradysia coprophila]|uniref:sodium-coupled monocarboxylate transporter 1-like n=1 Tax=Bradysia coprophila TaxID=38358 RepID=UPI00187D9BC4|nr:sodium-coupled monocarboxylate transporter 1-like [Bradysia coprophila]